MNLKLLCKLVIFFRTIDLIRTENVSWSNSTNDPNQDDYDGPIGDPIDRLATRNRLLIPLTDRLNDFYVRLDEKKAVLLLKKSKNGKIQLETIDSKLYPNYFPLNTGEFEFTANYLNLNESLVICRNQIDQNPPCVLLPIAFTNDDPKSRVKLGEYRSIETDYRQKRSQIWNSFRIISADGRNVIAAFSNETAAEDSFEPSWIIRQQLHGSVSDRTSKKLDLITTGSVFDHRLSTSQEFNATENVFAFQWLGYAYFLRFAYRTNAIDEEEGTNRNEWTWQLTRVCTNDPSRELQSRSSIPLNCSYRLNSIDEEELIDDWRPSAAYFDRDEEKFYVYVQPRESSTRRSSKDRTKFVRHRICEFDFRTIAREFERTHQRCYEEFSHLVAAHSGVNTRQTLSCHFYKQRYEESGSQCPYKDACDPPQCNQMYHLEIYTPIYGKPVSVIDFRYQSPADIDAMDRAPTEFIVVTNRELRTKQAFVRNVRGTVFMTFLNSSSNKPEQISSHAPAWTIESKSRNSQLFELADRSGIELFDDDRLISFTPDCSLFTECRQLMDVITGEQARHAWNCGWCSVEDGREAFSTNQSECSKRRGLFHKDSCPARVECFEPRSWSSDENVTLTIRGYFPRTFDYKVSVCGSECRDIKRSGKVAEDSLTCFSTPPFFLSKSAPESCGVEIVVLNPSDASILATLRPSCGGLIPQSTINSTPVVGQWENAMWYGLAIVTVCFVVLAVVCFLRRMRKQRAKKRRRRPDDFVLPPMVQMEMSRDNEYVQRRVHNGNGHRVRPITQGNYEDLSHLVPSKLLIRHESIELEGLVGQGHFGQVFKAKYKPTEDQSYVQVAVKTLLGERNARQFLQEGIIMETFDHENVLSLIGISFEDDNLPMIITPYMTKGDLLSYIRHPQNSPNMNQLLTFGLEIATGMQYLHKLKFIHRDLAARNCMIDENLCVKIADFGLSRDVYESESYLSSQNTDLPIRWMPPESIEHQVYSFKSDVWSYGVVLWELCTRGKVPYAGHSGFEVLSYLKSGRRLERLSTTPEEAYSLMRACWMLVPDERPDFRTLTDRLPSVIDNLKTNVLRLPTYYNTTAIVTSA